MSPDRQIDRSIGKQIDRWIDRQTDGEMDRYAFEHVVKSRILKQVDYPSGPDLITIFLINGMQEGLELEKMM